MKLLHIILTIVVMIQLSMAASIGRVKRDDNLVNALTNVISIYKRALPITETVTKDILTKLPKTLAYSKYRTDLEGHLKAMDEYRTKSGPCVDKTFDTITSFDKLIESYEEQDAPAEAKFVAGLVHADTRFSDLEKELDEWSVKYNITDIDESFNHVGFKDAVALIPLVVEVC